MTKCSPKQKFLCRNKKCTICFERSFASHEKSKYWSVQNEILPRYVFKATTKNYKFKCEVCDHIFDCSPGHIKASDSWCPYCENRKLCNNIDCKFCTNKTVFAYPIAEYWSEQNKLTPIEVFKLTKKNYYFDCPECEHTYYGAPRNLIGKNQDCSYCTNQKLCGDIDCEYCLNKSFFMNPRAEFWSDDNDITPFEVYKCARKHYKFDCPDCNKIYNASLATVHRGSWCNCVRNKTEKKLYDFLKSKYKVNIERNKRFQWCKNKNCLPFDIVIEKYKLIIELDGLQHFKQVANWVPPDVQQETDMYKMKLANEHGYSVIRILQSDVANDIKDWKNILIENIKKFDKPNNLFVGVKLTTLANMALTLEYLKFFVKIN